MSAIYRTALQFLFSFFLLIVVFGEYHISYAEDYETPHIFEDGDVISADIMNEVFAYIQNAKRTITASDLVGTWNCSAYQNGYKFNIDTAPGWILSKDELIMRLENVTIIFTDDGDETYSLSTSISAPNPFIEDEAAALNTNYEVLANTIFMNISPSSQSSFRIEMINETRMIWTLLRAQTTAVTPLFIFDKQNLPPAIPVALNATTSNLTITLTWTDASDDETGFIIMRKNILEGDYSEIATTNSDTETYTDTVSEVGDYWYRVMATNNNGDSLGSNVIKVTVTE